MVGFCNPQPGKFSFQQLYIPRSSAHTRNKRSGKRLLPSRTRCCPKGPEPASASWNISVQAGSGRSPFGSSPTKEDAKGLDFYPKGSRPPCSREPFPFSENHFHSGAGYTPCSVMSWIALTTVSLSSLYVTPYHLSAEESTVTFALFSSNRSLTTKGR